jgi:hypothetical protein
MESENTQAVEVKEPEVITGPQAVMATPAQLKAQMKRDQDVRKVIDEYIKANMVKGKDYGSIKSKTKSGTEFESKPSLLKPGAEKFCSLFKVRATFRKDDETCEMLGNTPGLVAYVCELVDTKGRVIGEGRGVHKVELTAGDFEINKAVKIAQKRAQVDAVLRTGCLSDFFTQDMEDATKDVTNGQKTNYDSGKPMTGEPTASQVGLLDRLSRQKEIDFDIEKPITKQEASDLIKKLIELPNKEV